MTDYIEALLAGQEEPEQRSETAELETGPAVIRLEARNRETPESGAFGTGDRAEEAENAAAPPSGADAPAVTAGRGGRAEMEEGSGAEALLPGLADTAAAMGRKIRSESGLPLSGVRAAAEYAGDAGGRLRRLEAGGGEGAAPVVLGAGAVSAAGGGRPSGAAWLAEQVGQSLRPAVEAAGRSGGSITVLRQIERSGGTVEAERLDRVFRRDARRYDGGFQLL